MKSKIAFEFSCNRFVGPHVFLWTFTFKRCLALCEARRLWARGMRAMRQQAGLKGIRAFEMHPGGHGLHVHVVTESWFDVSEIRRLWTGRATEWEGGRIHAARVPVAQAAYIGKYLSKSKRPPCLKGARLWAGVGGFETNKVRDIECRSALANGIRFFRATLDGFKSLSFFAQKGYVSLLLKNALRESIGARLIPVPNF